MSEQKQCKKTRISQGKAAMQRYRSEANKQRKVKKAAKQAEKDSNKIPSVFRGYQRWLRRQDWLKRRRYVPGTSELETFQAFEERITKPQAPMEA